MLAERMRLGLDRYDEVWDGEYHMVPAPNNEHQRVETKLVVALDPIASELGLHVRVEMSLFEPGVPGAASYRTPDLIVYRDEVGTVRGAEGPASLVVEIRSPHDESFAKLPFYERLGVGEVLIIEPDSKQVRRWENGPTGLVEVEPARETGEHQLTCLPVRLWTERGVPPHLAIDAAGTITLI
jgi:Uma2 family endonuclease